MKDPATWAKRVEGCEADIVCVGHSHMQFNLVANNVVVLNPGSVGQPRDGDPRAAYAIIEDGRIELKRIDYPIDETVHRIQQTDMPDRAKWLLSESLRIGKLPSETLQR
jgi:predicted phosphodiesterase